MGFAERRTPRPGEVFLDHVGWFVPDMEAAAAAFERLGFGLTPYVAHADAAPDGRLVPTGTGNRCAMLSLGYLEILRQDGPADLPLARQHSAALARYTGLHLIAFSVGDAEAARRRLADQGFEPLPVDRLRRKIAGPDGRPAECAFSVVRTRPGAMAEGRVQVLAHETPDLVWQERLIARDNALDALTGVVVCTADPAEAAGRYARFTGRPATPKPWGHDVALDRGVVSLVDAAGLAGLVPGAAAPALPFIAAAHLRSRDLAATRRFLAGRGVALHDGPGGAAIVPPEAASGAALLIHDAASFPPA